MRKIHLPADIYVLKKPETSAPTAIGEKSNYQIVPYHFKVIMFKDLAADSLAM